MSQDSPPNAAIETLISSYASATDKEDRRMYLRVILRRLEHDMAMTAERMRLLVVASAGEGNA